MDYSKGFPLRTRRDLGDIIGDGFKFIIKNISGLLMAWLLYVLPVLVIPLILLSVSGLYTDFSEFANASTDDVTGFVASMGLMSLGTMLGYFMSNLVLYATFCAYDENGNQKVSFDEISQNVRKYFWNYLVSTLVVLLVMGGSYALILMTVALSVGIGGMLLFVYIFVAIWLFINIQFLAFVRIREDRSVPEGWSRCFYLVKNQWWSTFGVMIVAAIVAAVLMYAIIIPISMLTAFSNFSSAEPEDIKDSLSTFMLFTTIITSVIALFFQQYVTTCKVLKYYDLIGQKDREELFEEIEDLGSEQTSSFENEGEY